MQGSWAKNGFFNSKEKNLKRKSYKLDYTKFAYLNGKRQYKIINQDHRIVFVKYFTNTGLVSIICKIIL